MPPPHQEFSQMMERVRTLLRTCPPLRLDPCSQLRVILLGVDEALKHPSIVDAMRLLFTQYVAVRICARTMLKIITRTCDRQNLADRDLPAALSTANEVH